MEHTIPAQTHGRYLVSAASKANAPLLIGFHGYGETAEEELARLQTFAANDRWTLVSVQGLHQFYRRRTNEIVASWMTRQNRERAIEDNIAYVTNVIGLIASQCVSPSTPSPMLLTGFSQGVAMAFRAAAFLTLPVAGVIACGGDVPPELDVKQLERIPAALMARGNQDEWYTAQKLESDAQRLTAAGVRVQSVVLDAAHEWTPEFSAICREFLEKTGGIHH